MNGKLPTFFHMHVHEMLVQEIRVHAYVLATCTLARCSSLALYVYVFGCLDRPASSCAYISEYPFCIYTSYVYVFEYLQPVGKGTNTYPNTRCKLDAREQPVCARIIGKLQH